MKNHDDNIDAILDSLKSPSPVDLPIGLKNRIDQQILFKAKNKWNKHWKIAAAVVLLLNTLAVYQISMGNDNSSETISDYVESNGWNNNDYYEYYITSAE